MVDQPRDRGGRSGPVQRQDSGLSLDKWDRGRDVIVQMIADGQMERVQPNRDQADAVLDEASRNLGTAGRAVNDDPGGALSLAYDAARKG